MSRNSTRSEPTPEPIQPRDPVPPVTEVPPERDFRNDAYPARVESVEMVDVDNIPTDAVTGDTIRIGGAIAYVRLPDGVVVTCRGAYTPRHVGEHVLFVTDDKGQPVERATVTVTEAKVK